MQHKRCWQATVMNWWAIFSCDPSSAAGGLPRRGRPDNFRWGPGAGGTGPGQPGRWACTGPRPALWSGSSRMADGGPREAGAAFPQLSRPLQRNQPAGLWIIPESSGFCRGRSHQWNQNVLFQMERQTMHNMSWCTQCDRLAPATNEAAGVDCRYRPAVSVAVLFFFFCTILASNSL